MLALVEIPEHGDAVFASRGGEGTVGGHGYCVDVAGVAVVVGLELELGQLPNLKEGVSKCDEKRKKDNGQRSWWKNVVSSSRSSLK